MKTIVLYSLQTIKQIIVNIFSLIVAFFLILLLFGVILGGLVESLQNEGKFQQVIEKDKLDFQFVSGDKHSDKKLLLLPIEGIILGSTNESELALHFLQSGITYGYAIKDILKKVAKNKAIKGVLLQFQTPGGTIFGSMAIYEGIKYYQKQTQQPVYAYVEGLSASGGMMAMAGADKIYADYGSMIGSIGVLGPMIKYYKHPTALNEGIFTGGVTTTEGIEQYSITAGFGKDLGNPFRQPSERELNNLQQGIDQEYQNFVNHIAKNRGINQDLIINTLGAQIFSNQQAQDYGLIDGTFNREQSIAALVKAAKLDDDYQLVRVATKDSDLLMEFFSSWYLSSNNTTTQQQTFQQVCQQLHFPLVYYGNIHTVCK